MSTPLIAASLLAADFADLKHDIAMVNESEADWFHLDVMDGVFVPNISFGIPVIKAIAAYVQKPMDIHLMIVHPEKYIHTFAQLGAHILTVHYEACTHLHRTIQTIKAAGMKAGVAINPHTPVSLLEPIINSVDLVCMMSVNPGFGGQQFIEYSYKKTVQLKNLITKNEATAFIEIDGGVNDKNAKALIEAGADVLVAGNFIFKSNMPKTAIRSLKNQDKVLYLFTENGAAVRILRELQQHYKP